MDAPRHAPPSATQFDRAGTAAYPAVITMRQGKGHAAYSIATFVVAVSFLLATLGALYLHHDDGCSVELHCFACHWGLASTCVAALDVAFSAILLESGSVAAIEPHAAAEIPPPLAASRAPPAT